MIFFNAKSAHLAKTATLIGAAVSLASCAPIFSNIIPEPAPANSVYRLSTVSQDVVEPNADAIVLRVDRPTVPRPLAGNKIMVSPGDNRILQASGAEWAERVPDLIQGSIMDVFSSRSNIIGVLPVSGARTELRIHLNVRNFEAVYDNGDNSAPLATVRYTATLANAANRNLIGSYDVRKTFRARDNRVSEIVNAQDIANKDAINDIADWVLSLDLKSAS